ncbi:LysR substrate-binding domain-containing protein [Streptomyces sp. NPDC048200]|uniref:LysR substrate-binding domain-containing protein n=1 Tax=Streptomyces sp. NPDC048200 TaxID=3365512 RepID=UPI00371B328C
MTALSCAGARLTPSRGRRPRRRSPPPPARPAGTAGCGCPDWRTRTGCPGAGGPREFLDAALRHGFRPRIAHVVAEWTARQGYVAAGLGVTPVPALAAEAVRPGIALVPVRDEAAPARAVYAATPRGLSLTPAGTAFPAALRTSAAAFSP